MPEIKRFAGFKIVMYFADENPPHVHVLGPGFAAKVALSNGAILAGVLPARLRRQARSWIAENQEDLARTWLLLKG